MILWILVIIIAFVTGVAQRLIFLGIAIGVAIWISSNTGIPFWVTIVGVAGVVGYLNHQMSKN